MSLLDRVLSRDLNEETRVITPAPHEEDRVEVEDTIASSLKDANAQEIIRFLDQIKERSKTKEQYYQTYDQMEKDSLVSGAMGILTDDICKRDSMREKRVWAEVTNHTSEAKRVTEKVNTFLTDFKMDAKIWGYTYNLLKYGEVFLKTYDAEIDNKEVDNRFLKRKGTIYEYIDHPEDVNAIEKFGALVGFGVAQRDQKDNKTVGYKFVKTNEYIHFCMDRKMLRQPIRLTYSDSNGDAITDNFKAVIGSSYLEDARSAWSIMDLIETLLLYVRFGKSDLVRIVKTEVGSSGRAESTRILRNVKRMFTNQDALDMKSKTYQGYQKPIPHGSAVYVATRQGKGDITVEDIGGNWDIKNIVDLDYWLNKLVAALKTPKAYLGLDDGNLTGLNNQSLTRQDIRYCRTVQAFQDADVVGVKEMCDHYLMMTGDGEFLDDYQICMTKILSAETTDQMEDTASKIELATSLRDFIASIDGADMTEATKVIIEKVLDLAEIDPRLTKALDSSTGEGSFKEYAGVSSREKEM